MTNQTREPRGPEFERATARVDRFLAKPEVAMDVAEGRDARAEMNRAYAMNLAMIRKAADLTQAELAERLGTDQGSVSRLENRQDMLLSTLASYLRATGVDGVSIVVTVHGEEYALDLGSLGVTQAEAA
ncbi:MAG TPA: helix-turn-helix domain-containing protein [Actinospica sp.]|jgi:DNA-binding XRE family transcriptional regulator|nr:helix-turn-helix domain-containing protein [Actinospica sp.]